jgi:hypothetical protein
MTSKPPSIFAGWGQFEVDPSSVGQEDIYPEFTHKHVEQGFAWRPRSVWFATVTDGGEHAIEVAVVGHAGEVSADALRVIEVPFEVLADGSITVECVTSVDFPVPPGPYLLRCEFLPPREDFEGRVRLVFARKDTPRFAVLRADENLTVGDELLTTAEPFQPPAQE